MCKTCQREIGRYRKGMERRGKPYQQRAPKLTEEERRRRRRVWYQGLTEEQREDRREVARMIAWERRRKRGVPERQFKKRRLKLEKEKTVWLPEGPLMDAIDEWFTQGGSWTLLEARTEIDEAYMRKMARGAAGYPLNLDHAEKMLLAMGLHLWEVYDDSDMR